MKRDVSDVTKGYALLEQMLGSKQVLLECKVLLLREIFARQDIHSEVGFDFEATRKKFMKHHKKDVLRLIPETVEASLVCYAPQSSKNIYDYEENFFYVLCGSRAYSCCSASIVIL